MCRIITPGDRNLFPILVLRFVCGVLVCRVAGGDGHDKVDFTPASHHNVPMRGHP